MRDAGRHRIKTTSDSKCWRNLWSSWRNWYFREQKIISHGRPRLTTSGGESASKAEECTTAFYGWITGRRGRSKWVQHWQKETSQLKVRRLRRFYPLLSVCLQILTKLLFNKLFSSNIQGLPKFFLLGSFVMTTWPTMVTWAAWPSAGFGHGKKM